MLYSKNFIEDPHLPFYLSVEAVKVPAFSTKSWQRKTERIWKEWKN
jgi:hypothetical protein